MLELALSVLVAAGPADCPWKEPKTPPQLEATVFSSVEFKASYDPKWFNCVKKAGGKLELVFAVGAGGELVPREPKALTSYGSSEAVFHKDMCATPGLKQVQATLKGSGGMERLDWSSSVVEFYCAACQWRTGGFSLALFTRERTAPGTWTLETGFDEEWLACAKKTGALEMKIFLGDSEKDVLDKAKEPSHVLKLDAAPRVKKQFSSAQLCKGKPKWVGYELTGTGEFETLRRQGRARQETRCP